MNDEETPEQKPGGEERRERPPTEEELREQMEEQLRKVRVQDLLLESVVSIINLAARRIAKEDERDLQQARVGIDAVRSLVGLLDPEPARQVQQALSEVQMLYAREAGGGGGPEEPPTGGEGEGAAGEEAPPSGPQGPSKLWTPPGT